MGSQGWIALVVAVYLFVVYSILVSHPRMEKGDRIFYGILFGVAIIYIAMHAGAEVMLHGLR